MVRREVVWLLLMAIALLPGGCRKKPKAVAGKPAATPAVEPAPTEPGDPLKIDSVQPTDPEIHLFDRIKPEIHATRGEAKWEDHQDERTLLITAGRDGSQLIVPVVPPPHYEMHAEVTRVEGNETFFWGIVAGDQRGMLSLDAFPKGGYSTGIGQVGNLRPGNKEFWPRVRGQLLSNSRPVLLSCVVTPDAIVLHFDGKLLLDVPAASVKQLRVPDFYKLPHDRCLFAGTWDASYRLRDLRLTPLTPSAAATRVDEMKSAPRLKTILNVTTATSPNDLMFRTAVRQTLPEFRALERQTPGALAADWNTLAPKLALPSQKQTRQKLARHEAADLVAIHQYINGKSPHSRLTVFGPNAVIAGDFALPYVGSMQVESAILARSLEVAAARVESNPPLLILDQWKTDPKAKFWSEPIREVVIAALLRSQHCQYYEHGLSEVTQQFGNLPRFALSGDVQNVGGEIRVALSVQKGQESQQRQWTFDESQVPSGGELADLLLAMIAEMNGGEVPLSTPAAGRVDAAMWASGQAGVWQHEQNYPRAAAAHVAAGLLERRETHFAKAAWARSQISGAPLVRIRAYMDALKCLEFAEAISTTPDRLRGEGAFVPDIAKVVLAGGADALSQLDDVSRRASLEMQAPPLLRMIAHRLATNASPDIYLKHLEATTPAAQRLELWRGAVQSLKLKEKEVKALLVKMLGSG